ncbi:MAG TPA: hypothetical protein VLI54_01025 [Bacillota bacterium]|nr:hypothetical protein [Bacillota bacterium]
MFDQLPAHLPDIAVQERIYTADAAIAQLNACTPPELYPADHDQLAAILRNPRALENADHEKTHAATLVWRLGVAHDMSRLVLSSVGDITTADPTLLNRLGFLRMQDVASDLLRANPQLLGEADPHAITNFWKLVDYDPHTALEDRPDDLVGGLAVLQHAAYLPGAVVQQMRDYRDNSARIRHEPQVGTISVFNGSAEVTQHQPDERTRDLIEAAVRTLLGTFVANYTGNPDDQRIGMTAVQDFAHRALTNAHGLAETLALHDMLHMTGITRNEWGASAIAVLEQRIARFAGQVQLTNTPLPLLTHLAESVRSYATRAPGAKLRALLTDIQQALEGHEQFYNATVDLRLDRPTRIVDAASFKQAASDHSTRARLAKVLSELRGETPPAPTAETVLNELETNFSMSLVADAFRIIGAELNPVAKETLLTRFDSAIAAAVESLPANHERSQSNALHNLLGHSALARFPSGRQYLADRTADMAHTLLAHINQPELWLNTQPHKEMIIANHLETLHDALWSNRDFYREYTGQGAGILITAGTVVLSADHLIDRDATHPNLQRSILVTSKSIIDFINEAKASYREQPPHAAHNTPSQPVSSTPLGQLLAHYASLG